MFIILLITSLITYFVIKQQMQRSRLPPGPFPFLFLGNIPQMFLAYFIDRNVVDTMKRWKRMYGDAYTFWVGPEPVVYLCTYETAKEVMITQGTLQVNRHSPYIFRMATTNPDGSVDKGMTFTDGVQWAEHRRFALTTFKNFGMGRNIMEEKIMEEFHYQMAESEKDSVNGRCILSSHIICDLLVGSIVNRLLFGYRFDAERKQRFFDIKTELDKSIDSATPIDLTMEPWWKNVPGLSSRHNYFSRAQCEIKTYTLENVERRLREISTGDYVLDMESGGDDFIDAYLIEREKRKMTGESMGSMDEEGLIADLCDLWLAGQETTTITLRWAYHYLLKNPDIMEKCREELFSVTNGNRDISLSDRNSTPYMIATINEVQRLSSILNFNLNRRTMDDTKCMGYTIPKDTAITAQLSLIMSDESVFEDYEKFDPSRYLGSAGKEMEQNTVPFGIGKRSCLGESLARAELYLIITNSLIHYNISIDPSSPPTGVIAPFGVGHRPKHFNIVFERNH